MQDIDLLRQYVAGDPEAFLVLFDRYRKPVYNFILRTVQDRTTAEDLLQDVFMRVIQRAQDFRGESKFKTWLYTIARNLCIDHIRKTNLRRNVSLNGPSRSIENGPKREAHVQLVDHGPGVDRHTDSKKLREVIADAVETLPEEQREVFLMRQVQNMPFQEIANVVGVSENTIKSRMRYALERLRELLIGFEADARSLDRDSV
jgi:RNA polymerase sigma-70 factor (ECF subfamily)